MSRFLLSPSIHLWSSFITRFSSDNARHGSLEVSPKEVAPHDEPHVERTERGAAVGGHLLPEPCYVEAGGSRWPLSLPLFSPSSFPLPALHGEMPVVRLHR
ncbi:hypothetical protein E2562_033062 [Oryza meyeriana var. granulata]|uniref:Uncharacterized protein n=1 Tax=Oryza meyeriana var. granulata TaxID=110450 RepID=A0A6G1DRZ0_9ORYZ|nr:hypothetical protein E2562_033062 [Oryza meyeriana var. granulata]